MSPFVAEPIVYSTRLCYFCFFSFVIWIYFKRMRLKAFKSSHDKRESFSEMKRKYSIFDFQKLLTVNFEYIISDFNILSLKFVITLEHIR